MNSRSLLPVLLASGLGVGCVVVSDDDDATTAATVTATESSSDGSATSDPDSDGSTSGTSESASGSTSEDSDSTTTDDSASASDSVGSTGDPTDSGNTGSDEGGGTIDVTLTGCEVDLGGTVIVSYNTDSLGVASVYDNGGTLTGSFQFVLNGTGTIQLSSQHRVDTGEVINLVEQTQGTWTNLDSEGLSGSTDRISGTLTVNQWDPANGVSDLEFSNVSLLNLGNNEVCTVNGTIVTTELYP